MSGPVLIRDILQARKEVPFYNQIDLLAIEDDMIIGAGGNLTAGFRVEGINLQLRSKDEISSTIDFIRKSLGHLPERTQYQFILKKKAGPGKGLYDFRYSIRARNPLSETLVTNKMETLRRDMLFSTDLYIFITKLHEGKQKLTDKLTVANTKAVEISREEYAQRKAELISVKLNLENAFGNLKVALIPMKAKEYKTFLYFHLNPTRAKNIRLGKAEADPVQNITLRSALLFSAPVVEREHFYQDGYFYQGINLLLPPESTDLHALPKMLERIGIAYDFTLSFYIPDNEKEIEALKTRANVSKTFGFMGSSKNYDAVQKYAEIDSLITEIKASSQKLAYYSLSFLIRDRNFSFLKRKQDQILDAFPSLGSAEGIADHMNHDRLFLSFLPGQAWMNPRRFLIQTDALAYLLPVQSEWRGTEKAKILMKTRGQELFKLDLFDDTLPAKHGLILGTTGSGKSFTTNYLLMHYLLEDRNNQLIIIDVGNSYRRLASIFQGAYFDIDLGEKYALNPLLQKKFFFQGGEINHESLAYLGLVVEKLVKGRPDETLTNAHKRLLEKAIIQLYQSSQGSPILSDLLTVLRNWHAGDQRKAQEFAKNMAIWAEGRYGKLLNRRSNIDVSNRFIVFELGKLDAYPELQSIIFFIIRSAISSKLYQKDARKVIVVDEGWRFFNDETGSRLIEDLYRTARKFNGMVLSISQSPDDFLNTKAANAIISNSFTKYILKLNKGHDLLRHFDLNESEAEETKTLVSRPGLFSELFIKFGHRSGVARLAPSALEYWLATTAPEDCRIEAEAQQANPGSDTLTLLKHLANKYPKGVGSHARTV